MESRSVLGLDIGGANLKAAHTDGTARIQPFELWKHPHDLTDALRQMMEEMPKSDVLAVTMTGELCDCFASKREGVGFILDAVAQAAPHMLIRIWTTREEFVGMGEAKYRYLETASANWLALAAYVGRFETSGSALLLDMGSTTTDIVPLIDGKPAPRGRTDPERLQCRELIYTGVRRTPICSLMGVEGAAELFATTLDVYLLLGEVPENPLDLITADGRPATREAAHARMARMVCADQETFSIQEALALAQIVRNRQLTMLQGAFSRVADGLPAPPEAVITSGAGEFLARKVLGNRRAISIEDKLGSEISQSACAYAVAVLVQESIGNQLR
jgi:probable H4MPT-linked C1 transfer pathway protein